MTKSISDLL